MKVEDVELATAPQLAYIEKLGGKLRKGLTKKAASNMIDKLRRDIAIDDKKREEYFERVHQEKMSKYFDARAEVQASCEHAYVPDPRYANPKNARERLWSKTRLRCSICNANMHIENAR